MMYKSVRGMEDILPERAGIWRNIEKACRETFQNFGYREIILPVVEQTEVFSRSLGNASDIVNKEMYTFEDKKGRSLTLRPEGTASVVRSVIENNLLKDGSVLKVYYVGPMFRYERPQAGRKRMFYQIGVEFFGSESVLADCDAALCLAQIFSRMKIPFTLKVNTLGCRRCSTKYSEYVTDNLKADGAAMKKLCEDCLRRLSSNVLRVFDCKNTSCQDILRTLIPIGDSVCQSDKDKLRVFKKTLEEYNIPYEEDKSLVRGLDYYTGIVYEAFVKGREKDAVAGGGRYDGLVSSMGGPETPAVGFAIGIDRIMDTIDLINPEGPKEETDVVLVSIGEKSLRENFRLLMGLRMKGIVSQMDYDLRSTRSQFRRANTLKARFVIVRGDEELQKKTVKVKRMSNGQEMDVREEDIYKIIAENQKNTD
ncbi:MAG: histidine--tRNA ligase [Candidatus Aureabacteria bacterium]|nr:histidine--tRNA ligase [Candidatus Auribacterota bacterium]